MLNLHNGILVEKDVFFLLLSHKVQKVLDLKFPNINVEAILFWYIYSCLAGESVHFFDEVHELGKIPEDDCVRRIYMARHIIEKYIIAGL